jgi:alpha-mannosidase
LRNLALGLRRADALGGALRVGYLPDPFGHSAQLPQLLPSCGAGLGRIGRRTPSVGLRPTAAR